jgi:hypothetical protein
MAVTINKKVELIMATTLNNQPQIPLTKLGDYYRICYKNGLRMFQNKRNKETLAHDYASRCIRPNQNMFSWGGIISKKRKNEKSISI